VIAFGVLLDTFLVRSVLVPALAFDIGPKIWWPSSLASSIHHRHGRPKKKDDGVAVAGLPRPDGNGNGDGSPNGRAGAVSAADFEGDRPTT